VFLPILGGLILCTWFALWAWSASPYAQYVQHGSWLDLGPAAFLCRVVPGGDVVVPALLHAAAWAMMIVAMMLPTTLPLLDKFQRMTATRTDRTLLMQLVVAGYLVVWIAFGLVAHGLDWLVHEAVVRSPWLAFNGWMLGAGAVALAGAFQFTSLKYKCLEKCRTPLSFIMQHWSGGAQRRQSFLLGVDHGAFCVGCCWALMLLMFVVGTGSIGWMMLLGAMMAVEKNMPWGKRISAPLGVALLAAAASIVCVEVIR
jgi:predicted metal-binding membrane protein